MNLIAVTHLEAGDRVTMYYSNDTTDPLIISASAGDTWFSIMKNR